jgi:glycosyltransferase involved in cell wall biosynthesis
MARAAIFTLDAARGGVPALAEAVYRLLRSAGHRPRLVYRATEEVPVGDKWRTLTHFLTRPPTRREVRRGMEATSVAAYPVAPRFQYHTLRLAAAWVRAPIAAVVSGSSHVGLARALARRPYVLWVATLYADEIGARMEAGDQWATSILTGRDWPLLEAQERLVYERATVILAASPHTRRRIGERWPELEDRVAEVFNPVDADRFTPGRPPRDPCVLLTARLRDRRKNVEMLIRALARVHEEHPSTRLVLAGDEPDAALHALVARLGLGTVTTFAGHVAGDELPRLYQRATIFALPSRQEGLGISVQEAMAAGLPVVATRCGGPENLIVNDETGLLVPNGDERAMAAAISALVADAGRRTRLGLAARARCLQLFSRQQVESRLCEAFREAFGAMFTAHPAGGSGRSGA